MAATIERAKPGGFDLYRAPPQPSYEATIRRADAFDRPPEPAEVSATRPSRIMFPWEMRQVDLDTWTR
jgi:hypothetical protein